MSSQPIHSQSTPLSLDAKMKYFLRAEQLVENAQLSPEQRVTISPKLLEQVAFTLFAAEKTGRPSILSVTHPLLWEKIISEM